LDERQVLRSKLGADGWIGLKSFQHCMIVRFFSSRFQAVDLDIGGCGRNL
jgi:hypothetical protein